MRAAQIRLRHAGSVVAEHERVLDSRSPPLLVGRDADGHARQTYLGPTLARVQRRDWRNSEPEREVGGLDPVVPGRAEPAPAGNGVRKEVEVAVGLVHELWREADGQSAGLDTESGLKRCAESTSRPHGPVVVG